MKELVQRGDPAGSESLYDVMTAAPLWHKETN